MIEEYRHKAMGYIGAAIISLPLCWILTRWEKEHPVIWAYGIIVGLFGFYGSLVMASAHLFRAKGYSRVLGIVGITILGIIIPFLVKDKTKVSVDKM